MPRHSSHPAPPTVSISIALDIEPHQSRFSGVPRWFTSAGEELNHTQQVLMRCARLPMRAIPIRPISSGCSNIRLCIRWARRATPRICWTRTRGLSSYGQITFHGPGQVIAYLLLDLRRRRLMARELVRRIEQAVIETLAAYNLSVCRKPGAPGLYIDDTLSGRGYHGAKIAALGLKIRRGCCYHGVSLNVNMDLRPFDSIHPCGDAGLRTVDMASLGVLADWSEAASLLAARLNENLPT